MKRRDFLRGALAVSALAGIPAAVAEPPPAQEYYELRTYHLKSASNQRLLDPYLEKAAIPALNRLGSKTVGVFTDPEAKDEAPVYMLIPFSSLEAFATVSAKLKNDPDYLQAGAEYLQTPKSNPVFLRIESWLMLAFSGIPRIELPAYSREKKSRIFEIRTYESYSETKALKKVDMFNDGEIDVMREVGLGPIFFGQALIGPNLPHLTYMLSAEHRDAHKEHWSAFGKHPTWKKMSSDPQYADTVSKITNHILTPTYYSQI
jgi:hypothetical protein